jgi:RNA-directed DNA polymerase
VTVWRPQLYKARGRAAGANPQVIGHAIAVASAVKQVSSELPPIFTLRHLAHLSGANYGVLRLMVRRKLENPYRVFQIRKRASRPNERRFRVICVPSPDLRRVQRWIVENVLATMAPHPASVAYSKGDKLIEAAEVHCGCRWLIKLDIHNFFESISEIAVYRVFRSFGYQPLVAFELARLCTRLGPRTLYNSRERWHIDSRKWTAISAYDADFMGHLPQGAPTSPMLANLVMRGTDAEVARIAEEEGLQYTRYADDLTLSTTALGFTRGHASRVIGRIYRVMAGVGLSPNVTKTYVASPGARKVVLGLLVDGKNPRLSREFKARLRQHLHFLTRSGFGPSRHAMRRGFRSISGLKDHVYGLVSFARQIEPHYGYQCLKELSRVQWPV